MSLSEIIARINERFGTNISDTDPLFTDQIRDDLVADERIQIEAAANDETSFGVGFDNTWTSALTGRMSANEKFAFELSPPSAGTSRRPPRWATSRMRS